MVTKTITVHVSSNNDKGGVLSVRVTPWRVHLDNKDVIEWQFGEGKAKNDIAWFRVEQTDPSKPWPFKPPLPPDASYTAFAPNGTVTATKNDGVNPLKDVISYGLTIGFLDDAQQLRTMYIDPDMIVDS
jgi:hypothetical protein